MAGGPQLQNGEAPFRDWGNSLRGRGHTGLVLQGGLLTVGRPADTLLYARLSRLVLPRRVSFCVVWLEFAWSWLVVSWLVLQRPFAQSPQSTSLLEDCAAESEVSALSIEWASRVRLCQARVLPNAGIQGRSNL